VALLGIAPTLVTPRFFAFDATLVGQPRTTLGAEDGIGKLVVAAHVVAAQAVHPHSVGVLVDDRLVVKQVAVARAKAIRAAAHPPRLHRRLIVQDPSALVNNRYNPSNVPRRRQYGRRVPGGNVDDEGNLYELYTSSGTGPVVYGLQRLLRHIGAKPIATEGWRNKRADRR